MNNIVIISEKDSTTTAQKTADLIVESANTAIKKNGRFVFLLAGGNTPKQVYALLKNHITDWSKWFLLYGDERNLPLENIDRNSSMVEKSWLIHINLPAENHLFIPYNTNIDESVKIYKTICSSFLPIDFALLGIGEDGHTASLFPENLEKNLANKESFIAITNSPKPPLERISINYNALNEAAIVCFLATGKNKISILSEWKEHSKIPINYISGKLKTYLLTDNDIPSTRSHKNKMG
jgi:6-phosphogluconolactonase